MSNFNFLTPGQEPGMMLVYNPVTKMKEWVDVSDWTEGPIIDSENIPAGTAITAQQQLVLFSNLNHTLTGVAKVRGIETSITRQNQLPAKWKIIVRELHLGLVSPNEIPIQQYRAYMDSVFAVYRVNNQREERNAPMWYFGFPYGIGGMMAADGALGPVEHTVLSNGLVATASQLQRVPVYIDSDMTFDMTCTFGFAIPAVIMLVPCVTVRVTGVMSGLINKPVM